MFGDALDGSVPVGCRSQSTGTATGASFEHYERIRAALAQDTTKGIAAEANALSPLARDIGGEDAGRAPESLAQAKHLAQARDQFGARSEALVPKLLETGLPGVRGFVCSMEKKLWAQRGSTAENQCFFKAMATCGTRIKIKERRYPFDTA